MAYAFPSVGVNTGGLRPGILQRISLFRTGSASKVAAELSPVVKVETRQGYYHYFAENDALLQAGGAQVSNQVPQAVNYDTPAMPGGLRVTSAAYNSSLYRWGHQILTLKQIEEFARRGEDIQARYAEKLAVQGAQLHAAVVGAALNDSGNYGSNTAVTDGSLATAQLQKTFNNLLLASAADGADLESGRWVAACNLATANILMQKNEVFQMGYALGYNGSGQTRTGAADMGQLDAFFKTKLIVPIELKIMPQYLPTIATQTGSVVMTTGNVALFKVAEAYGDSGFLQTMTPEPNAALGQLFSYSAYNPAGVGMYVESDFGVTVLGGTANKWARLATGLS
jgi:hypothetical protein